MAFRKVLDELLPCYSCGSGMKGLCRRLHSLRKETHHESLSSCSNYSFEGNHCRFLTGACITHPQQLHQHALVRKRDRYVQLSSYAAEEPTGGSNVAFSRLIRDHKYDPFIEGVKFYDNEFEMNCPLRVQYLEVNTARE